MIKLFAEHHSTSRQFKNEEFLEHTTTENHEIFISCVCVLIVYNFTYTSMGKINMALHLFPFDVETCRDK